MRRLNNMPNYKGWKSKYLKEIIRQHSDRAIIYFDTHTKNNLQNLQFTKSQNINFKSNNNKNS